MFHWNQNQRWDYQIESMKIIIRSDDLFTYGIDEIDAAKSVLFFVLKCLHNLFTKSIKHSINCIRFFIIFIFWKYPSNLIWFCIKLKKKKLIDWLLYCAFGVFWFIVVVVVVRCCFCCFLLLFLFFCLKTATKIIHHPGIDNQINSGFLYPSGYFVTGPNYHDILD